MSEDGADTTPSPTRCRPSKRRVVHRGSTVSTTGSKPKQRQSRRRKNKRPNQRKAQAPGSRYAALLLDDDDDDDLGFDASDGSCQGRGPGTTSSHSDSSSSSSSGGSGSDSATHGSDTAPNSIQNRSRSANARPTRARARSASGTSGRVASKRRTPRTNRSPSDDSAADVDGRAAPRQSSPIDISSDQGSRSSTDDRPSAVQASRVVDKAPSKKAQLEYELGLAEEETRVTEWETQLDSADMCVIRLNQAKLNSKALRNKVGKVRKAIRLFREAQEAERTTRLERYEDDSSLTSRRKAELTRMVTSKQSNKQGKLRGAEIIFQGFLKVFEDSRTELSATTGTPIGTTSTTTATNSSRPELPNQNDENYNPSSLKPSAIPTTTGGPANRPSRVQERGRSSSRSHRPANPASTSSARSAAASGTQGAAMTYSAVATGARISKQRTDSTPRSSATATATTPRHISAASRPNPSGSAERGLSSADLAETLHPSQASSREPTQSTSVASGTGEQTVQRVRQPNPGQAVHRPRCMLGAQTDTYQPQDLLFDGAPTPEECAADPTLWGRYINFLAGKEVDRNGFLRLVFMIDLSQIPSEYFKAGETKEAGVLRYIGSFFRRLEEVSDGKIVLIQFSVQNVATPLTRPNNFPQQLSKMTLGQARKYFPRISGEPNKSQQIWCDGMILTNAPDTVMTEARSLYRTKEFAVRASPHSIQDSERTSTIGFAVFTDDTLSPARIVQRLQQVAGVPIAIKHKKFNKLLGTHQWLL